MPAVSVIIPTFNHARYVLETLDSVFCQTFQDFEIIVVNDGSPDDTEDVLQPLVRNGRIRYFKQKNAGQAAARNRAMREATGTFVALLDDDDIWPADKLAWQVQILMEEPNLELVGGTVLRDTTRLPNTIEQGAPLCITYEDIFWGCPFTSPGQVLIRTEALRQVGGFDEAIRGVDDFDLYVRLARRRPLLRVARVALHYREHPLNMSKNRWKMLEAASICLRRRIPEVPLASRWRASRRAYRGLYDFVGRELVKSVRGCRLLSEIRDGRMVQLLRAFGPGLATDPRLLLWMVSDLIRGVPNAGELTR